MFVLRLLRWLFGYVVFITKGNSPERILNSAARAGVNLWNVKSRNGRLTAHVAKSQYKEMRPLARKSRLRLRICERHGLPFIVHKYHKRTGVLVGVIVFAAVLYVLSLYVWEVQISGNVELSTDQVEQVMSEIGISPGTLKKEIHAGLMEQSIMVRLPEVSWVSINMQGSQVKIELRESVVPPKIIPNDEPCNITAAYAGQILRLEVYTGTAMVKNGDAVTPGKLLVSGIVEDKYGNNTLKHASAKAYAATKRHLTVEVPLEQQVIVPTSHYITRKRIWVFGIELPVTVARVPDGEYERELVRQPVTVGDVRLPITLYTEKWTEQQINTVNLTEEQAAAQAEEELAEKERTEFGSATIVERQKSTRLEDGVYYLDVQYDCEEDIALESTISILPS